MAELSKLGSEIGATTSSAQARSSASSSGCATGVIGSRSSRIAARCSSTERMALSPAPPIRSGVRVVAAEHRVVGDALRGLGRELDVADHLDAVPEGPVAGDLERGGLLH